jgi:hypothetical protein
MGNPLILHRLPKGLDHDVFTKTLSLEDVLVSTIFGTVAYGSPAMLTAWRRRFTTMRPLSPDVQFDFWPTHRRRDGRLRAPDVFIHDVPRHQALIVEAKRGRMPRTEELTRQLVDEGQAARATHGRVRLYLLVVSDAESEPAAFEAVRALHPRLYSSGMRHASWTELCEFLHSWTSRPECDAGHRRMIDDTLAVMAKYGRGSTPGLVPEDFWSIVTSEGAANLAPRDT